ncbi:MAG: hypothetical protein M3169_10380 [Candidatus Eremiobacteraeota bacterium]|nr:hypothetical protein [Candidatus Eremiobacteraeota bacterium]
MHAAQLNDDNVGPIRIPLSVNDPNTGLSLIVRIGAPGNSHATPPVQRRPARVRRRGDCCCGSTRSGMMWGDMGMLYF